MSNESSKTTWPDVTIAMPTCNGMEWLGHSLGDFLSQQYPGHFDMLLIDSGSEDGTDQLDGEYPGVRVHRIAQAEFGHGTTRNLAAQLTRSELILLTVQDARPRNQNWLRNMVEALIDHKLDAVCGGQAVPHDMDKNPLEWYRPVAETDQVTEIDGGEFIQWPPSMQQERCGWDNVNALYRREALTKRPFEDVRFGEDMLWARGWLGEGGRIGYAYHCKLWHYHHHHADYTRSRVLNTLYWRWKVFGVVPPLHPAPSVPHGLRLLRRLLWNCRIVHPGRLWMWWSYNWTKSSGAAAAAREFAQALSRGPENLEHLYDSLGRKSPMARKEP